ncbi:hypothetical protein [Streptomyces scabiei]|uniref:hypothetical protein n=1 Tax=Streptomyces scabiei TaxID=1930 RepID=UPI0029A991B4|nr:hypothetical protein [Streptomyces scabiei]MDX3522312.1 hypothetical protein [Streptomyces scabiei]
MRTAGTAGTSGTADDPPPTHARRLRRLRRHVRAVDGRGVAGVVVGVGNVLLCCVLLLVAVGVLFVEPATRAEETAAWHLAGRIYGWWFLGGLVLLPALGMTRTLAVHLATMIAAPAVLFTLVVLAAVR